MRTLATIEDPLGTGEHLSSVAVPSTSQDPAEVWPTSSVPRTVLTVAEVARHLRCSKAHVYNVIEGKVPGVSPLPAIFMGRRKLVRLNSLELWEKVNEKNTGNINILSSPEIDAARRT